MRRVIVLLNTRAGGRDSGSPEQIAEAFRASGCCADVRPIRAESIATTAGMAIKEGAEVVVIGGGDGSVSAAASVLTGTRTALGILPCGTLNHFAKDLGIPLHVADAAGVIAAGRTTQVDVGDVNGRPFVNNVSLGMYATVVAERGALQRAGRTKWHAQGLAILRVWRHYQRLRLVLRTDRREDHVRTPFVFVGNNEYQLSGFELGGRASLNGGRLHVCMAPGMTQRGVARMIAAALFGDVCRLEEFDAFTTPDMTVDVGARRIPASIDGEVLPVETPLRFASRPGALRVVVP